MKAVLAIAIVLALVAPVLAWVYIDLPTALFFLAATAFICISAAMPIVFSVGTRRNDLRREAQGRAEEIRVDRPAGRSGGE